MIPIKGYATFHPLKHCWIGSGFRTEWFEDLSIYKNKKIIDPLKRIAEETEEDYQTLEKILKEAGIQTYRSFLNIEKVKSLKNIQRPPVSPRDHFAVIGEKIYALSDVVEGYADVVKQIDKRNLVFGKNESKCMSTAAICRVGKDIWWDVLPDTPNEFAEKYKQKWIQEGFRVHITRRGYHSDGVFCVVKPGCIVSLYDIQNYETEFPGWDVLYLPDQSWNKVVPFTRIKDKVGGRWWLKGEEYNDLLIEFVNTWLKDWVGYVEETVFDVNMLSLDENTIICNNYNKEVFDHFKKHRVEPIIFNFRHRYFWDGGIHCITQDLYREGKQEDYFG
jgi:predicted HTH domain antitoxin